MTLQELYQHSMSQAHQDFFGLYINQFKQGGYFVDLGCNEPFLINNTALMERGFLWNGVLLDKEPHLINLCQQHRRNRALCCDLMAENVQNILEDCYAPQILDYVSLDLDGDVSIKTLKDFDFQKYQVRCITFEHDAYLLGDKVKSESRAYMQEKGMELVCQDVTYNGGAFEDWYVNPNLVPRVVFEKIRCAGKSHDQVFLPVL